MNLPQLTAMLGKNELSSESNPLKSLIKPLKIKVNKGDELYAVKMIFDLDKNSIFFEILDEQFNDDLLIKYNYFGNNPAASSQIYLTRSADGIRYLFTSVINDLSLALKNNQMEKSELAKLLEQLVEHDLVTIGNKKGQGNVNLAKLWSTWTEKVKKLYLSDDQKKIIVELSGNPKEYSYEEFVRRMLDIDSKKKRLVIIIPAIKFNSYETVLPLHDDYISLVKKVNKLESSDKEDSHELFSFGGRKVCYICGDIKPGVKSDYSTKFDRSGINKIFITKKVNFNSSFTISGYDNVYSICQDCYQDLKSGEKVIKHKFEGRVANEKAFILPEGILENFGYENIRVIKDKADFAFRCKDAQEWLDSIETEAIFAEQNYYVINFVIYDTDGNSVTVLDTFEDVPTVRLKKIMNLFSNCRSYVESMLKRMSLDTIYRIIPVKQNNKGKQLDIGRVISLYKALLTGAVIDKDVLFRYAIEALEKGLKQLTKDKTDNYTNMNLYRYTGGREDFFIKDIVMSYLVLIRVCQKLGLLRQPVFIENAKGSDLMTNTPGEHGTEKMLEKMEEFLERQGFSREAKALFYLGTLIRRVAIAQYKKEHKSKPVLKKISFQGMSVRDIIRLHLDVLEKLRQYNKFTFFAESLLSKFHYYFEKASKDWTLTDEENVFYIMAGYAYLVANKVPDLSEEEEESIVDDETDENSNS